MSCFLFRVTYYFVIFQYVPLKKYAENLKKIKKALLNTGAMVAFATSTPVPFSKKMNKRLQQYNKAAIK